MVVTSKVEIIDTKEVPSNITNKANSKANSNNTEAQETIKVEEIRATSITRKEVAADPTIKIKDLDKVANHIEVVEVDQDQNEVKILILDDDELICYCMVNDTCCRAAQFLCGIFEHH